MALKTRRVVTIGTISIANGASPTSIGGPNANGLLYADDLNDYDAIGIFAPAALTGTVSLQAADSDPTVSPTWGNLQVPAGAAPADITIAAGKCVIVEPQTMTGIPVFGLRLNSSGAEAAQRDFKVYGYIAQR